MNKSEHQEKNMEWYACQPQENRQPQVNAVDGQNPFCTSWYGAGFRPSTVSYLQPKVRNVDSFLVFLVSRVAFFMGSLAHQGMQILENNRINTPKKTTPQQSPTTLRTNKSYKRGHSRGHRQKPLLVGCCLANLLGCSAKAKLLDGIWG